MLFIIRLVCISGCYNLKVFLLGTRKSFDHLISDSKAPKRPEMESGITTPLKMRRVAENEYEIGQGHKQVK